MFFFYIFHEKTMVALKIFACPHIETYKALLKQGAGNSYLEQI